MSVVECDVFLFSGPPPSYQSLFGEIQGVRQSSSSTMDFMRRLILLLAGTSMCLSVILSPSDRQPSLDPKFIFQANIERKTPWLFCCVGVFAWLV